MTNNTPRFLVYLGIALVTLFGLGYALMLGQCAGNRDSCIGNPLVAWQAMMNTEEQLSKQAKNAIVGTLIINGVIFGTYVLIGKKQKDQKEDQTEHAEKEGLLKRHSEFAVVVVIAAVSLAVWVIVSGLMRPPQNTEQNSVQNFKEQWVLSRDDEIIAKAEWDKGYYDRTKVRITKLLQRDPDWAVKVMLYMISPSVKDLQESSMIEVEDWPLINIARIVSFKQVFTEQEYIQGSEGNRTFKQITSDETAQGLFEEAIQFQEKGKTNDTSFPIRLNKYAVSLTDEIGRRGMLVD